MAIAYDNVSSYTNASSSSTATWNHTVTSNDNGIVIVTIGFNRNTSVSISSATYAGNAMTAVAGPSFPLSQGRLRLWQYYYKAPPTGSSSISITFSTTYTSFAGGAVSYTGVDQSATFGTAVSTTASNSPSISVNVSSATGEVVVDSVAFSDAEPAATIAAGAGQTERMGANETAGSFSSFASDEPGAGTTTMSWTVSPNNDCVLVGVPLKRSAGAIKTMNGVDWANIKSVMGVT